MQGDPSWMRTLLAMHVTAGFVCFLVAPIPLATAKGGVVHRRWGKIYLWSMGIVAATAIPMALYRPVLFLALVAVFSFYCAFSGYRVLQLKSLTRDGRARVVDWAGAIVAFCVGVLLASLAVLSPASVQHMGAVAISFGLLSMLVAVQQIWIFVRKPSDKRFWWYKHLGNFIASYIAAWTAFSVTTLPRIFGNHLWLWLWPTATGVPAIILTTSYYKRRFAQRDRYSEHALASSSNSD